MKQIDKLDQGFALAQDINRKNGKSYYWATQFFPKDKKLATYALYAFFRLADDIVDATDIVTEAGKSRARRELSDFRCEWQNALSYQSTYDPVLFAAAHVCKKYSIPEEYSQCFLNAMAADISKTRYRTYDELLDYMQGSAASVGLMMAHVIGFSDCSALPHLANLGNAMQLTNFLRDVDEDYRVYNRVYIPLEDLERFDLTENDIAERRFSNKWKALMQYEAARVRTLYADAEIGISMLTSDAKKPVQVASVLYSAILGKLQAKDWNVFAGRAHTNTLEKLVLTFQTATKA